LESLIHLRDVLLTLVERDFKVRYKRSFFGIGWSLLVPLAQCLVLYIVFNKLLPLNIPNYVSFLLVGLLPWTWFHTSLMSSSNAIVENRELVKQIGFPVAALPIVAVLSNMVHFVLSLPILFAFVWASGIRVSWALLALPLVILIQFLLSLAMAYVVATLQVKFRDTHYLLGIFMFLFFYLTPVFWDSETLQEPARSWVYWNPVASLLAAYRGILIRSEWPSLSTMLIVTAIGGVVLWLSYSMFLSARSRFVEEL
jgi:lipopolysaccharide transport system permease protein